MAGERCSKIGLNPTAGVIDRRVLLQDFFTLIPHYYKPNTLENMFNNKRIKELEFEVSRLAFIIANPPKYKVGDIVNKEFIVSSVEAIPTYGHGFFIEPIHTGWQWENKCVSVKTGKSSRC